jgi:hypothetical protein
VGNDEEQFPCPFYEPASVLGKAWPLDSPTFRATLKEASASTKDDAWRTGHTPQDSTRWAGHLVQACLPIIRRGHTTFIFPCLVLLDYGRDHGPCHESTLRP